jgi:uncharacterized protein YcnI
MQKYKLFATLLTGTVLSIASISSAFAHAEFDSDKVTANMHSTFNLNIPHGCGKDNTTQVKIAIPSTLSEVMPMSVRQNKKSVKGWSVKLSKVAGKNVVVASGPAITSSEEKPLVISFMGTTPKKVGSVMTFPTTQYCGKSISHWVQPRPADGSDPAEDAFPVPTVTTVAKGATTTDNGMNSNKGM